MVLNIIYDDPDKYTPEREHQIIRKSYNTPNPDLKLNGAGVTRNEAFGKKVKRRDQADGENYDCNVCKMNFKARRYFERHVRRPRHKNRMGKMMKRNQISKQISSENLSGPKLNEAKHDISQPTCSSANEPRKIGIDIENIPGTSDFPYEVDP